MALTRRAAPKKPLTPIQRRQKAKKRPTYTISFRLDETYLAKLDNLGDKRGNSVHEQARVMVMAMLDGDEAELFKLQVETTETRREVEAIRKGLQPVLTGLVHAVAKLSGETFSLSEVEAFIRDAFQKREGR